MDGCVVCVALPTLWIVVKCFYVYYLKIVVNYWNDGVYVDNTEENKWQTHFI